VQQLWPKWLCVGATSHFGAMVSERESALNSGVRRMRSTYSSVFHGPRSELEGRVTSILIESQWG
jgi:hypothetical protein